MASFNDGDGVWRTISGRRVFIRSGQSISSAMKASGKFKSGVNNKKKISSEKYNKKLDTEYNNLKNGKINTEEYLKTTDEIMDKYTTDRIERGKLERTKAKVITKQDSKAGENEKSAKNKTKMQEMAVKGAPEKDLKEQYKQSLNEVSKMEYDGKINKEEYEKAVKNINDNYINKRNEYNGINRSLDETKAGVNLTSKQKEAADRLNYNARRGAQKDIEEYLSGKSGYEGSREDFVRDLSNEWGIDRKEIEKGLNLTEKSLEANMPPGARFNKMIQEAGVKTFADEIRERELKAGGNEKSTSKTPNTISKEEYDKMPRDYKGTLRELVDTAEFRGENKADLIKLYTDKGYDVDKDKTILSLEKGGTVLKPVKIEEKSTSDIMNEKIRSKREFTGYQAYLRDRYGTENEDVVSAGYKNKKDLYQEYKDEVVRRINKKRMEKGTTSLEQAYRKAFQEYKKEHPNTKMNLQRFIKMSEE